MNLKRLKIYFWKSMNCRLFFLMAFALLFLPDFAEAQQPGNPIDNRAYYRTKNVGGIFLHTAGVGAYYRRGWRSTGFLDKMFNVELLNVKHPKEYKVYTQGSGNSRGYFFGKENSFSMLRASYGWQKVIFDKEVKRGVRVSYLFMFGPSLGFLKPIYVEVNYPGDQPSGQTSTEPYDFDKHSTATIEQRASFLYGINEIKLRPGGHTKAALNFEYSSDDQVVRAIEVGGNLDVFGQKIDMMANTYNNQFFVTLYLSVQFGKKYL